MNLNHSKDYASPAKVGGIKRNLTNRPSNLALMQ